MANIPVGGQLVLNKSIANIDARFGPYSSIQSAYNAVIDTCDEIISGLHFGIIQSDGSVKEYAWTLTGGTASDYKEIGEGGGSSVTVVDSLNSTSSTAALSAKQGKVLSEQISTKLSSPIQISDVAGLQNALNNAGGSGEGGTSVTVVDNLNSTSTTSALSANQGKVLSGMIGNATRDMITSSNLASNMSNLGFTKTDAGSIVVKTGGYNSSTMTGSTVIGSPINIDGNNVTYVGRYSTVFANDVTIIGGLSNTVTNSNKFNTIVGTGAGFASSWNSGEDSDNLTGIFTIGDNSINNMSSIAIVKDSSTTPAKYKYYFKDLGWDGVSPITDPGQKDLKTYIEDLVAAAVEEALSAQ